MRQAFRIAIALIIGLATASSSFSAPAGMNIVLGRRQVRVASSPVTINGNLYVPLDVISALGADYISHEKSRTVTITLANGDPTDIPATLHGGKTLVSLNDLAKAVGASPQWRAETQTLRLVPVISGVEYTDGQLVIRASHSLQFKGRLFDGLKVYVIDISPAKLASATKVVDIGEGDAIRARIGQFDLETTRIAVDLKRAVALTPAIGKDVNVITVPIAPRPAKPKPLAQTTEPPSATTPKPPAAQPPATSTPAYAGPVQVSGVKFEPGELDRCKILIATTGRAATRPFVLKNPNRLVVDVIGCKLNEGAAQDTTVSHPVVQAIRVAQFQQNPDITRVVLDLTRKVTFSIMQTGDNEIEVGLGSTQQQGLKGATIVVDPGHGGSQTGAISPDGACLEKDINLAVARRLTDLLQAAGASAVMTRYGDTALGLPDRPKLATDLNADVFISLHCNSLGSPNKISGVETYYHFSDPICRRLAVCVQDAVIAETSMVDRGARSDTRVAPNSGFSVLRNATVPAVLLEMGYLDYTADRKKLINPEHQDKMAQGVLNGLKLFLEGEQVGSTNQQDKIDER